MNIDELLDRSSLGSPAARKLKKRTPRAALTRTLLMAVTPDLQNLPVPVRPSTYASAPIIGSDYVRTGAAGVVVDLATVEDKEADRLVDFMSGLVFGRNGSMERVASKLFVLSQPTEAVSRAPHRPRPSRVTSFRLGGYTAVGGIGKEFRAGNPVIADLTSTNDEDGKRIVDFLAGLAFGLNGSMERVAPRIFLLQARNWYQQAAEAGDAHAMYRMGRTAEVAGDLDQARTWYQQAAEAGDPHAMYRMGRTAEVAGDLDQARTWYQQDTEAGDANAIFNRGGPRPGER